MSTAKPTGVTGAIVIAIVLAAWEALTSVAGIAGRDALESVQEVVASRLPVGNAAEVRAQLERVQAAMTAAVNPQYAFALIALTLPVAVATIVTALRLNKGKPHAARWFAHAVSALAVVEVVQLVYAVHMSRTMQPFMAEIFRASFPPSTSLPANVDPAELVRTLQTMIQVVTVASTVLGLGLAAAKIFACLYARHCARKPEVVAWTSSPAWASPPTD